MLHSKLLVVDGHLVAVGSISDGPGTEPALWLAHAAPSDQLPVWRAFAATEPRRAAYDARAPPLRA